MTIFIVTYDVSETSIPLPQYCETFTTLEEAEAYVKKDSCKWDHHCYEIVEKTFN